MKEKRSLVCLVLCIFLLCTFVVGCNKTETTTPTTDSTTTSEHEETDGTVSDGTDETGEPLVIELISPYSETTSYGLIISVLEDMYKEVDPNFEINAEIISDNEAYLQKLKILATSGALPDWFFGDPDQFLMGLVEEDLLVNIGDLVDELGIRDNISKITLDYVKLDDGESYLLGLGANCEYWWYHPSMFEEAGVEVPSTFDEFFEVCANLKAKGITPLVCTNMSVFPLLRWFGMIPFRMTGNDFINQARTGEVKFSSEVGLEAARFIQKLSNYFQDGWAGLDSSNSFNFFLSGQCAMMYMTTSAGISYFADENQELVDDIDFFTTPALGTDDATAPTDFYANPGKGIAILKSSMNDQMKSFVKFFIENFGDVSIENKFISGLKPSSTEGMSEFYKELYENFNSVDVFAQVWDVRMDTSSCEVLKREIVNLALGEITPEEFAQIMDDAVAQYVSTD